MYFYSLNKDMFRDLDSQALPAEDIMPVWPVSLDIPRYLKETYWWAYVHPRAVKFFDRHALVNLILFGNYRRLRDGALRALGAPFPGRTLQVACVYGDFTPSVAACIPAGGTLDVVDVLPIQLENLQRKLSAKAPIALYQRDSSALGFESGRYDQAVVFFLLHEQPEAVRRETLREVMRVVKPGGRVVIVDYHLPSLLHPLRGFMRLLLAKLEPYALDLWRHEITEWLPASVKPEHVRKRTFFGGLYQKLVIRVE